MIETPDSLACTQLKGVGPKVASYLQKLGLVTVQDLLFHLPLRYENRTYVKPLRALQQGDHVQVVGEIVHAALKEGRRKSLLVKIQDETGFLTLRFFHYNAAQIKLLSNVGQKIYCYGEVRWGITGYEMVHPEYYFHKNDNSTANEKTLTAIYPATEGLHQQSLRKLTDQALLLLKEQTILEEFLPAEIRETFQLPNLINAIEYVHRPPCHVKPDFLRLGLDPHQQRLVFEELLAHQLSLARIKMKIKILKAPKITDKSELIKTFLQQLPYELTTAQKKVIDEILVDLKAEQPMLRLVQGDVGSGKTVVSAIIALYVIGSGYQVAIMAPTELLAEQHYKNFVQWFSPLNIQVGFLTGAIRGKKREEVLTDLANGNIQIVIGTHALFQNEINFAKLGLIVIDEQHRFGVHQRLALLQKGIVTNKYPHQLIMSATPIPRTLAMTAYADLDCSTIDELPPGRTPVDTIVIPNTRRDQLIARIKESCLQGKQVYWVCTLIEESELLQCQAAEKIAEELSQALPALTIGLVHGRMKPKEKEQIMLSFKDKQVDLLVATTVIEVGVDVPNATLMVIENSERLGLSQLHQLRGRVGRGSLKSHCILLYQSPLSKLAQERLAVLREHTDGFVIAEKDLALRGPGEVLGTKQTGLVQFKIADLSRDKQQLPAVQKAAAMLLQQYPEQVEALISRWLGGKDRFSDV